MLSIQPSVQKQLHIKVAPHAQVQLQVLPQHQQAAVPVHEEATDQPTHDHHPQPSRAPTEIKQETSKKEEEGKGHSATNTLSSQSSSAENEADIGVTDGESRHGEGTSAEAMEEESDDVHIHEEVVMVEQEMSDKMEVDSGPYFRPPRPPRRVSLLEYKKMKNERLKRLPSEESQQHTDLEGPSEKESMVMSPLNEEGGSAHSEQSPSLKLPDAERAEKLPAMKDASGNVHADVAEESHSEIDSKLTENDAEITPKQMSQQQQSSHFSPSNDASPAVPQQDSGPDTINWSTTGSDEARKKCQGSDPSEVSIQQESKDSDKETEVRKPAMDEPMEEVDEEKERKEKDERSKERTEKVRVDNREREKRREHCQEKERERSKRLEEIEKERRRKKERDRMKEEREKERAKEEREKKMSRKASKPVEPWKSSSYNESLIAHTSPAPRFGIPIHRGPGFHPHPMPIPPPAIPPPQPPPPQPFIGFPHTHHHIPFHQPPPPPFTPPHPHPPPLPQPDVWNMFGNLFAQHGLFPADDPPLPPPRSPSPPPPSRHFSSPRRKSPSPRHSPPPHNNRPLSPPPPRPRSTSPPASQGSRASPEPPPPPFPPPRTKSGSPSPSSQPRQLDAKQFRIISELIKKTTVKKCDVSVQVVPPRMISEGTQDGSGFRLRSTAVQVKARTYNVSTYTECKPEVQDR